MAFGKLATVGAAAAGILMVLCMILGCAEAARGGVGSIKLSRKQVSIYFHDLFNVTDFIVVKGPNFKPITPVDAPFGTIYVFNDLVTETTDPRSTPLGNLTGSFIASTQGYGNNYMMPMVLALVNTSSSSNPQQRGMDGTLTMLGIATPDSTQPQPITGGTGFFAFVLGTYSLVPIDVSSYVQVFRLDLDLYWPPYSF